MTARRAAGALLFALAALPPSPAAAQERTMVVYLPSTPNESASRVAGSVTELATYLSARTGMPIQVKAFRRAEDAAAYLSSSAAETALVVSEQSLLLDLPAGFDVIPAYRFVRDGRETRRRLVVVRNEATAPATLAELRGRTVSVAIGSGGGSSAYLARAVFGGEIDPARWFGRIMREPDDFSAITNVLFGRADAAIVSDDNPLLAAHLGKDLKEIYASRPVSLPVVAIKSSLSESQRASIEQALAGLRGAEAQGIFAGLSIERLQRIPEGNGASERAGLLRLPSGPMRALEIAAPPVTIDLPRLGPLPADQLPFFLGVDLLDLPIPLPSLEGIKAPGGSRQP